MAGIRSLPKSRLEPGLLASRFSASNRCSVLNTYTPMLASAVSGLPGMWGGWAGFSRKRTTLRCASMSITPKAVASASGTSMQATVHFFPSATWSAIRVA
ncbi:hypothetical protein FQZ97_1154670 [compost metagenome]